MLSFDYWQLLRLFKIVMKKIIKFLFKNPLSEYAYFLFNWVVNKSKFKRLSQEYLSFVFKSHVGANVKIYEHAVINRSTVGSYTYIGDKSRVNRAIIGKFCCIGPNCILGTGRHPSSDFVSAHPIFYSTRKQVGTTFSDRDYFPELGHVTLGNDVWIGANVIILTGATIRDGAIIGAGSVVTKDIPPYTIYGGIPAKFIRNRFEKDIISFLLNFEWWGKDEKWLRENFRKFHDVQIFIDSFREK